MCRRSSLFATHTFTAATPQYVSENLILTNICVGKAKKFNICVGGIKVHLDPHRIFFNSTNCSGIQLQTLEYVEGQCRFYHLLLNIL